MGAHSYNRLIIATGATPFIPPVTGINLEGIHQLWTMNDAKNLKKSIQKSRSITVIGAGILGTEAALDYAASGKKVTLIETRQDILAGMLLHDNALTAQQNLQNRNIKVLTGTKVLEIKRDSAGLKLILSSKATLLTDSVLVSAGAVPNIALANKTGIKTERAIVTNVYMQSSVTDIMACGNCAQVEDESTLLWNPAMAQGITAGQNAFQIKKAYKKNIYPVHVKNKEMPLFSIGNPLLVTENDQIIQLKKNDGVTSRTVVLNSDGIIKYAAFIKDTSNTYPIEKAVKNRLVITKEIIKNSSIDDIINFIKEHYNIKNSNDSGWVCQMCGYTHEGSDAPDICCVCGVGKDQFLVA